MAAFQPVLYLQSTADLRTLLMDAIARPVDEAAEAPETYEAYVREVLRSLPADETNELRRLIRGLFVRSVQRTASAAYERGRECLDTEQIDEAVEAFSEAVRLAPQNAAFLHWHGRALEQQGDVRGALAQMERSADLDPEGEWAWECHVTLGRLHGSLGERASAEQHFARASGLSDDYDRLYRLGRACFDAGIVEEARHCFEVASRMNSTAECVFCLGATCFLQGDYDQAVATLQGAVERAPDNAYFLCWLGRACLARNDLPGAVHWLQNSVERDRTVNGAAFYLGLAYLELAALADPGEAEEHLRQAEASLTDAVRLDPTNWECRYWLGKAHYEAGDFDRAESTLLDAIDPSDERSSSQAYHQLGVLYFEGGQHHYAERCFEQAQSVGRRSDSVNLRYLGLSCHAQGRHRSAVNHLVEFVNQDCSDPVVLLGLARSLAELGRNGESAVYSARAQQLADGDVDALWQEVFWSRSRSRLRERATRNGRNRHRSCSAYDEIREFDFDGFLPPSR